MHLSIYLSIHPSIYLLSIFRPSFLSFSPSFTFLLFSASLSFTQFSLLFSCLALSFFQFVSFLSSFIPFFFPLCLSVYSPDCPFAACVPPTNYSGRIWRLWVIKCRWFFFFVVVNVQLSRLRSTAFIRHCFVQAKWPTLARFVCINKIHQAVESPSYVHRSSAN